jgi:hypothetical protein
MSPRPRELAAVVEVSADPRGEDPGTAAFLDIMRGTLAIQVEQLRKAQAAGEFGDFEPWTTIPAICAALVDDGLGHCLAFCAKGHAIPTLARLAHGRGWATREVWP